MSEKKKSGFSFFTEKAASHIASFDTADMKEKAQKAGEFIGGKAMDIKGSAMAAKEDITEKLTELDRMLEASITEYNDAYTLMNDKGVRLFIERNRSVDTICFIEQLINSIASQPKSFESDFDEIKSDRNVFQNLIENAFSSNIREALNHSAELARAVGVKEDEILTSVEDIDAYFLG